MLLSVALLVTLLLLAVEKEALKRFDALKKAVQLAAHALWRIAAEKGRKFPKGA